MQGFTVEDLPVVAGCRHTASQRAMREAVLSAIDTFWTTNPTTAERTITRLASIKNRIATAAGTTAGNITNKMVARALQSYIDERFGGTD